MSKQIETDIFNFMSKMNSASACVNSFLPFWRARGLTPSDVNIICNFLFSNGAYKEVLHFNLECLEKDEPVSWFYLGKALKFLVPNIKNPVYEALKNYISDNRKLDEFTVSDLFDTLYPFEGDIKLSQIQRKIQVKERHRQTLLDQIRVFNQSRNFSIEKQTIQKFMKFFPNDKQGKELLKRFETEDLQRFFQRYKNERRSVQTLSIETFTDDEKQCLQKYFEQVLLAFETDSFYKHSDINGYIYFFLFLEDYSHALQLIPYMEETSVRDWLHLDLLILNHKYAETLSYMKELELKHQEDPAFYTAKVYYVAQCFWGLGDRRKAIELMENLIQIKPDYRLASSILKDWRLEL